MKKETVNKLEALLDTSLEHFTHGWVALEKQGMITYKDDSIFPPSVSDKVGSASYHFAAVADTVKRAYEIIAAEQSVQRMGLLARIGQWFGTIAPPLTQTVGWLPCQQENRMNEKITARMKWIVKILETHPDAVIKHYRDWFWEKSLYALEWTENGSCYQSYVTTKMRQQLSAAGLIEIVEERPIYSGGKFRTTERDWGLPKRQPTQHAPDAGESAASTSIIHASAESASEGIA